MGLRSCLVWDPHGARAEWPRSGGAWRVEPVDEFDEHLLETGVVDVGVLPDERDHLPIAVGGLGNSDQGYRLAGR